MDLNFEIDEFATFNNNISGKCHINYGNSNLIYYYDVLTGLIQTYEHI